MQLLSDGARFVRLVVFIISLYFLGLLPVFLPSVILPFLLFVPLVVVVVPFCVFSQSEMLNASLISSFYSTGFNNFQFYSTGFNNFQFYSTGFYYYPVLRPGSVFYLSFSSGPFYKKCTCYTCNTSSAFFSYTCVTFLCNVFPFDNVV